jgi:Ribosomal protein L3
MIVVGVVGYVQTPRGLRTLNTVWAGAEMGCHIMLRQDIKALVHSHSCTSYATSGRI